MGKPGKVSRVCREMVPSLQFRLRHRPAPATCSVGICQFVQFSPTHICLSTLDADPQIKDPPRQPTLRSPLVPNNPPLRPASSGHQAADRHLPYPVVRQHAACTPHPRLLTLQLFLVSRPAVSRPLTHPSRPVRHSWIIALRRAPAPVDSRLERMLN